MAPPDSIDKLSAPRLRARLNALRRRRPRPLGRTAGERQTDDRDAIICELQIHQIELEMQNRELREAQHALEETRDRYFELYDLAPVVYVTLNRSGRIQEANLTATKLLGLPRTRLLDTPLVSHVVLSHRRRCREHIRECLAGQTTVSTELVLEGTGRIRVPVHLVSVPLRDGQGRPIGCRTTMTDVTELERARERLAMIALASRILVGSSSGAVAYAEVIRVCVTAFANIALLDLVEGSEWRRAAEAFARCPARDLATGRLQRRAVESGQTIFVPDCSREGAPGSGDWAREPLVTQYRASSLLVIPIVARARVAAVLTLATVGEHRRFSRGDVAAAEDLATRIGVATDQATLHRELQAAVKAREEILSFVAHDLRNPVQAMIFSAETLIGKRPDVERRAGWNRIDRLLRAGRQMNRLIDDLLDFSSIEADKLELAVEAHDVRQLIAEAAEWLAPLADRKGIGMGTVVGADVENTAVTCDASMVVRVLSNIIGNAVKFTPTGGTITLSAGSASDGVVFTIHDSGPGLSTANLSRMFEKHWRAEDNSAKGHGLGLFISKRIVEALGGTIWCELPRQGGTAVSFTLPRSSSERRGSAERAAAKPSSDPPEPTAAGRRR